MTLLIGPTPVEPTPTGRRTRWLGLVALLLGTAALYLWQLGDSGWANAYYSAAAQAGSQSWLALFFGSFDAANSITVDKTPGSIWVMALSVRAFGLNPWSILVPQAVAGVASVALLHASVRRWFGAGPALLAGATLALTPVAALMFRYNNPDALLVLLLVAAAYAVVRAIERAGTRWLVLAGALVGFAFLTKMLQALLVLPAFGAAYLLAAPATARRRVGQLGLAALAMVVAGGWWVAIVELIPPEHRPYIGGSQHDSVLELALGYNGLGRITGNEVGSVGGGPGGAGGGGRWGETGWTRLLGAEIGGQAGWLLPAALVLLTAGLVVTARARRTDRERAALVLWGGWLIVTAAVFSFMRGIFHAYYTVALAPAIGALVGIGSALLWRRRADPRAAVALAAILATTVLWSATILGRTPGWQPWLRPATLVIGLAAAAGLLLATLPPRRPLAARPASAAAAGAPPPNAAWASQPPPDEARDAHPSAAGRLRQRVLAVVAVAGVATALGGPAAYAVHTVATAQAGAIPSAGPAVPGAGPGGGPRQFGGAAPRGPAGRGTPPGGSAPAVPLPAVPPPAGPPPAGPPPAGPLQAVSPPDGALPGPLPGVPPPGPPGSRPAGPPPGATIGTRNGVGGGLLRATTPPAGLVALLERDAGSYEWVAATVGANNAAGIQLATGRPVMPIGGFNGSDPSPTLAEFQRLVGDRKIHYFVAGGIGMPGRGGSDSAQRIAQWVASTFTATTVAGVTVFDLAS